MKRVIVIFSLTLFTQYLVAGDISIFSYYSKRRVVGKSCGVIEKADRINDDESKVERVELPDPVKRYFDLVLPENVAEIKKVSIKHRGFFKMSQTSSWIRIRGKQYFKTEEPEFRWIGKTLFFRACDRFIGGKGSLRVRLFGFIPIAKFTGYEVDQAELLRWLGESLWFPTNLIPGENLHWSALDSGSAVLTYHYNGLDYTIIVRFDEEGYISRLEAKRYMEKGKLVDWVAEASEYKEHDGIVVPEHMEASWIIDEEEFQYVDFYLREISFEY